MKTPRSGVTKLLGNPQLTDGLTKAAHLRSGLTPALSGRERWHFWGYVLVELGEWERFAYWLRDALWCWGSIAPHACGGEAAMTARATSAVGIINAREARDAVADFIGYYGCYVEAPAAAFIGGEA